VALEQEYVHERPRREKSVSVVRSSSPSAKTLQSAIELPSETQILLPYTHMLIEDIIPTMIVIAFAISFHQLHDA
jgi:hypothetical protein